MGLAGLWHGADPSFIYWALGSGAYIALARVLHISPFKKLAKRCRPFIRIAHMLVIVISQVLFRAPNMGAALNYLLTMVSFKNLSMPDGGGLIMLGCSTLMLFHVMDAKYL